MNNLITIILTSLATVISGLLLFIVQQSLKRQREASDRRDDAKAKENVLILRSLNALGRLTMANSLALRDGKINGEMSAALNEYEDVEREMYEYLIAVNAENKK
jgi:hypothetical protein